MAFDHWSSDSKGSRKCTSESHDTVHYGNVNNGNVYSGNRMVQSLPYHGCWSIVCNKNGAQGNETKRNVMHLKKLTSLPENIGIDNIITGNCGPIYLVRDNNTKSFVWEHDEYGSISMVICNLYNG